MADPEGSESSNPHSTDDQERGLTEGDKTESGVTAYVSLPTVHDKHVKIYIEEDAYDPESEEFINKVYPDDPHIHDDHELARPRTQPVSRLQ